MARKREQRQDAAIPSLIKYLRAGKSIDEAVSCCGLTAEQAAEALAAINDKAKSTFELANLHASDVLQHSLAVLKELAHTGETEEVKLGAARELRRFAFDLMRLHKPKEISIKADVSEQKDLWDF